MNDELTSFWKNNELHFNKLFTELAVIKEHIIHIDKDLEGFKIWERTMNRKIDDLENNLLNMQTDVDWLKKLIYITFTAVIGGIITIIVSFNWGVI